MEDAPLIAQLLHDFNTEYEEETPSVPELTRHVTRMLSEEEMTVLLAPDDAGLALLRFRPSVWTERNEAYLQELYVAPGKRGDGIGEALLEAVLETSRKANAAWIELNTAETDVAARTLYKKFGFTNEEGPQGAAMLYYEREL